MYVKAKKDRTSYTNQHGKFNFLVCKNGEQINDRNNGVRARIKLEKNKKREKRKMN